MIKTGFLVAGFKGLNLLKAVHSECETTFVSSYLVKGTRDDSFEAIKSLSLDKGYRFVDRRALCNATYREADLIFLAGWQYLLHEIDDRFVILHDSLLPRFRGFSPTVTALILGEQEIGVTALKPTGFADRGPVYDQRAVKIGYPIKIKDAYLLLADCYAQVARSTILKAEKGDLRASEQDDALATYSLWRDERDYWIDWSWSSRRIARFVDAVGWPYLGARAVYGSAEIFIDETAMSGDLSFVERHPGKIWALSNGTPEVVCGEGMIRIISARDVNGHKVEFSRLRERLGFREKPTLGVGVT